MPETFGEKLRRLLKQQRLSQQELADALDIPRNTVWRWVNDKTTPESNKLQSLATLLHVSVDDLLNNSAPDHRGWVLQIKVAHEFKEEVIDLSKDVPIECSITATPKGAYFTLGGNWGLWTEDNKKSLIKQINKFFSTVQQNGIALGGIKKS